MKTFAKYLSVFILGLLFSQTPDLAKLYIEHVSYAYQAEGCKSSGYKCEYNENGWADKFAAEHPTLQKMEFYIQMGEGPLYWVASGRCSNAIFYNVSAAGKDSGKMTNREYFFSRCSKMMNDASDIIFGEKSGED